MVSSMPWPVSRISSSISGAPSMLRVSIVRTPPSGHRFTGVHGKIHHHLVHLAAIRLDSAEIGRELSANFDIVPKDAVQDTSRFPNEAIEIERLRPADLLAAEGQQLLCELGALFTGFVDCGETLAEGIVGIHFPKYPIGVGVNHGEKVVEVVSNSAGQPAEAFHLLRLNKLFLQALSVGDIEEGNDNAGPIVARGIHDGNDHVHQALFVAERAGEKLGLERRMIFGQGRNLVAEDIECLLVENRGKTAKQFFFAGGAIEIASGQIHVENPYAADTLFDDVLCSPDGGEDRKHRRRRANPSSS